LRWLDRDQFVGELDEHTFARRALSLFLVDLFCVFDIYFDIRDLLSSSPFVFVLQEPVESEAEKQYWAEVGEFSMKLVQVCF